MDEKIHDFIVVGSGCSGAMTAQTLVEAGKKVIMLDAGYTKDPTVKTIPNKDFLDIRKTDPDQSNYILSSTSVQLAWGGVGKGEQITPPRSHIMKGVDTYLPVESETFSPFESLAYGGLGAGWGLQCWEYSDYDLSEAGLNTEQMRDAYEVVSKRIGVSATDDSASEYTLGTLKTYQPSPKMDRNHTLIFDKYTQKKQRILNSGFVMGRTPLALITKNLGKRKGYAYRDMDFYSDNDQSAWRPWITVDQLKKKSNFTYKGGLLVTKFDEKKTHTEVHCLDLTDNSKKSL